MPTLTTRIALVAALAGATSLGCASTRTLGTQWSDELATREIETRLATDPDASAYDVDVKVFRGKAVLLGEVEDERSREAAVQIASNVAGVQSVDDELKVLGVPRETPFDDDPDFLIASRVSSMLAMDGDVRGRDIDVEAYDGIVYLTGIVRSESEKKRAATLAANARGVDAVRNLLDVSNARA
jgi:hyperosmotically inducible periplasmic protein